MTRDEFGVWLGDFQMRFPDSKAWLAKHKSTITLWFNEVFCNLALDDCLEANKQLMHSDDPIRAYERETIASRVAKIARRNSFLRSDGGDQQEWKQNHRRAMRSRYVPQDGEPTMGQQLANAMRKVPNDG